MNRSFTEVSHFMYACLSLVMVGNKKAVPGKLWALERENNVRGSTSAANLYLHKKKYFFVPGKDHVGKNAWAHNSRAGFSGVWSGTSPSLLSSDSFTSLLSHFLTAVPHSFPVCLLFLPQDSFTVTAKHLCCTSSL